MVGSGLVASLARPDGNTTGVSILATELDGKRQEHPDRSSARASPDGGPCRCQLSRAAKLDALQEAARAHNIELSIHRVARGEEIAAAIDSGEGIGC